MIAHLKEVQKREKPLLNELSINEWKAREKKYKLQRKK